MLVLSRRTEQSVVVGGANGVHHLLTVTVLDIKGRTVRLGFEADAGLPVHRSEVWERIRADGRQAALAEDPAAPLA